MAKIELVNVCKKFEPTKLRLLDNPLPRRNLPQTRREPFSIEKLNLTIPHAKTLVILGPSGCGKTTILRMIAGLIAPDAGEILFNGTNMNDVPPGGRRIGFLFQNYALYPHMTSKRNILSYFIFRKKTPELDAEAQAKYQRTSELLGVEIEYLQDRMPPTLSGGERQRVALGRCITRDPALFLLDEPFSNLDPKLREKYRVNLKTLLAQFNITTVYVTHDQQEALILADLIAVMDAGKIEQVGTYEEIYSRPTNIFIAEFLNLDIETPPINLIEGERVAPGLSGHTMGVRPENVRIEAEEKENSIKGTVINRVPLSLKSLAILTVRVGEDRVVAAVPIGAHIQLNDEVWLSFGKYHVFDKKTGRRTETH
ncbi:sulfate transport system ATP-binding protein [Anaerolineae bacterium]|nr:sulfate transport system ATP-binding protein [Anaerolineae bacterium]